MQHHSRFKGLKGYSGSKKMLLKNMPNIHQNTMNMLKLHLMGIYSKQKSALYLYSKVPGCSFYMVLKIWTSYLFNSPTHSHLTAPHLWGCGLWRAFLVKDQPSRVHVITQPWFTDGWLPVICSLQLADTNIGNDSDSVSKSPQLNSDSNRKIK